MKMNGREDYSNETFGFDAFDCGRCLCPGASQSAIPIPGTDGKRSSGISLTPESMEWLRAEWPDDYKRILKVFPYAKAQADRAAILRAARAASVADARARKNSISKIRLSGDFAEHDQGSALQPEDNNSLQPEVT